jgi:hypothetical protein
MPSLPYIGQSGPNSAMRPEKMVHRSNRDHKQGPGLGGGDGPDKSLDRIPGRSGGAGLGPRYRSPNLHELIGFDV